MGINNSKEFIGKVLKYMNLGNKGGFEDGLTLLEESGYKPAVCKNLRRKGDRFETRAKLRYELGGYLRYYRNPTSAKHDDISEIKEEAQEETAEEKRYREIREESRNMQELPDVIRKCWHMYDEAYVARSRHHKALKELGERNDAATVEKRRDIAASISGLSLSMSILWCHIDRYEKTGEVPTEDIFEENKESAEEKREEELPSSLAELYKMNNNIKAKITKSKNQLNYQCDTSLPELNPMPDGPKKEERLAKIAELEELRERVKEKIKEMK